MKKLTEEEFNQVFKDKLSHFEDEAPASGWDNLTEELTAGESKSALNKYVVRGSLLLLLLAGATYLGYFYGFTNREGTAADNESIVTLDTQVGYTHQQSVDPEQDDCLPNDCATEEQVLNLARIGQEDKNISLAATEKSTLDQKDVHQTNSFSENQNDQTRLNVEDGAITGNGGDASYLKNRSNETKEINGGRIEKFEDQNHKLGNQEGVFAPPWLAAMDGKAPLASSGLLAEVDMRKVELPQPTQPGIKPEKEKKDLQAQFFTDFMAFATYNRVKPNQEDDIFIRELNTNTFSGQRLGYKLSGGIELPHSKRFTTYYGLSFLHYTQFVQYAYYDAVPDSFNIVVEDNQVILEPVLTEQFGEVRQGINSLGLQIGAKYRLYGSKLRRFIDVNTELHRVLNYNNIEGNGQDFITNNQVFINAAYRMEYDLNRNLIFKLQPSLGFSLLERQADTSPLSVRPFNLGLDFGIIFKIR
ncbi:MAG: hypothetical protein AAFX87_17970 [Bacteroidota bacterium]